MELFQRTLDWALAHKLPVGKLPRAFSLRTYRNTRVANYGGLVVTRVADRVDANLICALRARDGLKNDRPKFITPREIAVHHSLAVAFGRMLDETRLTGQIDFRAEFDLTNIRRNFYPRLPDLSATSSKIRRLLPKVHYPDDVLRAAKVQADSDDGFLSLDREFGLTASFIGSKREPWCCCWIDTSDFSSTNSADSESDDEKTCDALHGEYELFDACESDRELLQTALADLPGCQSLNISYDAPVKND